jgi:hypothetical protein
MMKKRISRTINAAATTMKSVRVRDGGGGEEAGQDQGHG